MAQTKTFEDAIKSHLDAMASRDENFRVKYVNEKKSIEECCDYIVSEVRKSGSNGFADDEIYALAVHYYEETDLKVSSENARAKVVVNHAVELTEQEKSTARAQAIEAVKEREMKKIEEEKRREETKKAMAVKRVSDKESEDDSLLLKFEF